MQAKRYAPGNNVDGAVIGCLRGSLPVEAHGIVITTSDFTKQARIESVMSGLKPIALVSGSELVELLVDLGIGVAEREIEVLRIARQAHRRSRGLNPALRQSGDRSHKFVAATIRATVP